MRTIFLPGILLLTAQLQCQLQTTNWPDAGFKGSKPVFTQTVNIMNHGGNISGGANNIALQSAIAALGGNAGVVYFPAGVYTFTGQISVNRDSILFRGDGHKLSRLVFSMNGALNNCINVYGQTANAASFFMATGARGSYTASVSNQTNLAPGEWVFLQCDDTSYMTSSWAYGSLGQIMQIQQLAGSSMTFHSPLRFNYLISLKPRLTRVIPRTAVGFECLAIERVDNTTFQTSLISFDYAAQCWIHGVEGDSTNYAHVELNRSSNVSITNSWFHHSHGYGSNGQGYGVVFQYSTNECLAENNVFEHLRHSILFQAGANGNLAGFNYSFDAFWQQGFFPSNSAGDIVFHGNYPFFNLAEGNLAQNAVIDNSHGHNGPYNTFFRNRLALYGLIMNSGSGDTMQFYANEIPNLSSLMGNYSLTGSGHYQHGNIVRGQLTPSTSAGPTTFSSLAYPGLLRPLCYNETYWPQYPAYNQGENAAYHRVQRGVKAECECSYPTTTVTNRELDSTQPQVFPNPATAFVAIAFRGAIDAKLLTLDGRLLLEISARDACTLSVAALANGCYLLIVNNQTRKLIIHR